MLLENTDVLHNTQAPKTKSEQRMMRQSRSVDETDGCGSDSGIGIVNSSNSDSDAGYGDVPTPPPTKAATSTTLMMTSAKSKSTTTTSSSVFRHQQQQSRKQTTEFWSLLKHKLQDWEAKLRPSEEQITIGNNNDHGSSSGASDDNGTAVLENINNLMLDELTKIKQEAISIASGERCLMKTWGQKSEEDDGELDVDLDDEDNDSSDKKMIGKNETRTETETETTGVDDSSEVFQLKSATDWRILHDLLAKYTDMLERELQTKRSSSASLTGFRFHRYRAELEKRRRRRKGHENMKVEGGGGGGRDEKGEHQGESATEQFGFMTPKSTANQTDRTTIVPQSCVRELSNVNIEIDHHGRVFVSDSSTTDIEARRQQQPPPCALNTPIHLWNLNNCHVKIDIPRLPALFLVGLKDTDVVLTANTDISSTTIHATDCHRTTLKLISATTETAAAHGIKIPHQMRIHKSDFLSVHFQPQPVAIRPQQQGEPLLRQTTQSERKTNTTTKNITPTAKSGAIILEDSTSIEFVVHLFIPAAVNSKYYDSYTATKSSTILHDDVVKDFNWLRPGIPSPNFKIKTIEEVAVEPSSLTTNDTTEGQEVTNESSTSPSAHTGNKNIGVLVAEGDGGGGGGADDTDEDTDDEL